MNRIDNTDLLPNTARETAPAGQSGIVTILHIFSTFAIGGSQRRMAQLANNGSRQFHHVILPIDGCDDAKVLVSDGALISYTDPVSQAGSLPVRVARYCRHLNDLKPDLIATYNWGAIEWALANWFVRLPHIHVEDGFGIDEAVTLHRRRTLFRKVVLKNAKALIVPSLKLQTIAEEKWAVPAHKRHYIPNGIDVPHEILSEDQRRALRRQLDLPENKVLAVWVGAMRPEKNVGRLVDAFSNCPTNSHLVLVGDGPERSAIEARVQHLNLKGRVRFMGNRADVLQILPAMDIMTLCSDTEQMPIVILEAMACGLPVASVDVGDVKSMVAEKGQVFVEGRDATALAKSLGMLVEDEDLRHEIGEANHARAHERFRYAQMQDAFETLWSTIANRPRPQDTQR